MENIQIAIDKAIQLVQDLIGEGRTACNEQAVTQTVAAKWFHAATATLEHIYGDTSKNSGLMNSALNASRNPFLSQSRKNDKRYLLDAYLDHMSGILARLETQKKLNSDAPHQIMPTNKRHPTPVNAKVFVVHGRDDAAKSQVARLIDKITQDGTAIILHEQINRGMTLQEKFQTIAESVGFAVVLLTPDDIGGLKEDFESSTSLDDARRSLTPRARPNVILELGYFLGKLGNARVCALRKGDTDIPSDYSGVVYTPMDPAGAWETKLAKELRDAGYAVDMNKL